MRKGINYYHFSDTRGLKFLGIFEDGSRYYSIGDFVYLPSKVKKGYFLKSIWSHDELHESVAFKPVFKPEYLIGLETNWGRIRDAEFGTIHDNIFLSGLTPEPFGVEYNLGKYNFNFFKVMVFDSDNNDEVIDLYDYINKYYCFEEDYK